MQSTDSEAGLTKNFYKKRWQLFLDAVMLSAKKNEPFDESSYTTELNAFEDFWVKQHDRFIEKRVGNSFDISKGLYAKYAAEILADTQ